MRSAMPDIWALSCECEAGWRCVYILYMTGVMNGMFVWVVTGANSTQTQSPTQPPFRG